jgi:hypothetical protein
MATGYRNVVRDIGQSEFQGRPVVDYMGFNDNVVTEPSSSASAAGGMWVSKNLFRTALNCMWFGTTSPPDPTPIVSVVEVTWDEGDVLETKDTGSEIVQGGSLSGRVPDPPVKYVGYRVSAVAVGAELTYDEIRLAANDISQQAA